VVAGDSKEKAQPAPQWTPEPAPQWKASEPQMSQASGGDPLTQLERVAELHRKGVLSDAEFSAKKAELLSRI